MEVGVRVVRGGLAAERGCWIGVRRLQEGTKTPTSFTALVDERGSCKPPATAGGESWGLGARSLKSGGHKR